MKWLIHSLWLIVITATVAWASWVFRYTPIKEQVLLDRWTGELVLTADELRRVTLADSEVQSLQQPGASSACGFLGLLSQGQTCAPSR